MSDAPAPAPRRRRRRIVAGLATLAVVGGLIWYLACAVPFLAITRPVPTADLLVVEAWMKPYMLPPVAAEYKNGHYKLVLVSGVLHDQSVPHSVPAEASIDRTVEVLASLGVPRDRLVACPAPFSRWRRTAASARAVKSALHRLGVAGTGLNVITDTTHGRESWAAYDNMLGDEMPVGIISLSFGPEPARPWWLRPVRAAWVTRDFVAWLKEVVLPMHS